MRTKIYYALLMNVFFSLTAVAQHLHEGSATDTSFFNYKYWNGIAAKRQLNAAEKEEFLNAKKREFEALKNEHRFFTDSELVWVTVPEQSGKNMGGIASTYTGACTNIDFETGNMNGWVRKTGFHPLWNVTGCCPNNNGAQAIVTGNNLDPYGGFPIVFPDGGTFSLRLGNNALGGVADRIEQTFSVTPQNANFIYRYAVVLNDQGHPVAQQPAFTIEMIDSTGFQVPCTFYTVAAASNIAGFFTSSVTAGSPNAPVVYRPWTSVAVDLTPSMGQVVTLRFTTYDCSQGGHFGYAYIDGVCTSFQTNNADTTCPGVPTLICGPVGYGSYFWHGPNSFTSTSRCINVSDPGLYSCQTIISAGCPGPTFNHTLSLRPKPVVSFTPVTTGACAVQYTFNSNSSISGGSINSYTWSFGDNTSTFLQSPAHNYPGYGTYAVKFKAISDYGCSDSAMQSITIYPFPNISYSPPSNCINTVVQFTNTSSIPVGTISSFAWNLGNGVTSNLINPTNTYSTTGPFNVTLTGVSDQGCVSTLSSTLGIFPPPVVTFSASNFCFGDATAFTSSTSIASGTLVAYSWDFGDGSISTGVNPARTYTNPGTYVVSFSATSNHNCVDADTQTITINPLPVTSYTAGSVCLGLPTTFSNTSQIPFPYSNTSYTWNFGNGNTSNLANPVFTYTNFGTYNPTLTVESNTGCRASGSTSFQVHPLPNISFSPPSACINTAIQFTNTTTIPTPYTITSYSWNFGNGNTTTSVNPVYSYTLGSTYTVILSATSNQGCSNTSTTSLVIWPEPIAGFTVNNACAGTAMNFVNTSTIALPDNIPFYSWDFGNGGTSSLPNPAFSYSSSGSYTVNLTATSNHGCTDTYSLPVTAYPRPFVSISATSVCPSVATTFVNNSTITPGSITSYTWSYGDGSPLSFGLNPTHTYSLDNSYIVQVSASSNQGCVGTGSAIAVVYPSPVLAFSPPGACANSAINFTNTSSIAYGSINSYSWNFGNGFTSTSVNPTYSYPNPGTYQVQLSATSNLGCSTTNTITLPIYTNPTADFTFTNQCFGDATAFTGISSIAPGNSISFHNWNFGNGFYSAIQNPNHSFATASSYAVTYSVTSNNNCATTITKTVTINPAPAVSFSAPAVCLGNITNFVNTTTIQGAPANNISSWSWNYGDGSAPYQFQNAGHTYTAFGAYVATLTAVSNFGCARSATAQAVAHPVPLLNFDPPFACVNTAVQFSNTSVIPLGSITSYSWNLGNNTGSNQFQPVYTYTASNNYIVTLTGTSNMGCTASKTASLDIYAYPEVTVTPLMNGCINNPVTIVPNINYSNWNNSSISSYTWNFGNSQSSVVNGSSVSAVNHTYGAYGTFTVSLTANTNVNCRTTNTAVLVIYPKPNPSFVSQKYCYNDSTTFINTSTIPQGSITSHLWFFSDGITTSTQKNPRHVYSSPGTYTVILSETSNPQAGVACTQSVANTITINPLPQPAFIYSPVCFGSVMGFTNNTNPNGIVAWSWDFDNDGNTNTTAQNVSYTYPAPGVYTVNLRARNSFSCVNVVSNTVQVYSNPVASFTANAVCFKQPTSFSNLSTPGDANTLVSYKWHFSGQDSSALASPQYSFSAPGVHTVQMQVQSSLGCRSSVTSSVMVHYLPVVEFTSNPVCQGAPMHFINQSYINDASTLFYRWDYMGDGWDDSSATHAISPITYPGSGGYSFKLQAVSDKGCRDTKVEIVRVYANPVAAFITNKACAGDKIVFSNLSSSADGTLTTYIWDFDGDNIPDKNEPNPTFTYTLNGEYSSQLTVISQFGCSNTRNKLLFANPKPVAAYRADKTSGCPPLTVSFQNLSSIASGTFSTTWNFGDLSPTIHHNNPSHTFSSGYYDLTLELTSDSGCVTKLQHPHFLEVHEKPVAAFKIFPEEIDEDEPNITVETRASNATQTRYYVNDGSTFTTADFSHNLKNLDGSFQPMIVQVVKNEAGCTDTTFDLIRIRPAFTIYVPDAFTPNGDGINDSFLAKGVGIKQFEIQIFDRWGHKVFVADNIETAWDGRSRNSIESVKQDVYIWKAQVLDIHNKKHQLSGHVSLIK